MNRKKKYDPKKVVFLDCDGIINARNYYMSREYKIRKHSQDHYCRMVQPSKLELLRYLQKKTHCVFVMSSSWRQFFFNKKYKTEVHRLKRLFLRYNIRFVGRTGSEYDEEIYKRECTRYWSETIDGVYTVHENPDLPPLTEFYDRGLQIKLYCERNRITNFIVLDDDGGDLVLFKERFIQTSWYGDGLTKEHVDRAITILNS